MLKGRGVSPGRALKGAAASSSFAEETAAEARCDESSKEWEHTELESLLGAPGAAAARVSAALCGAHRCSIVPGLLTAFGLACGPCAQMHVRGLAAGGR